MKKTISILSLSLLSIFLLSGCGTNQTINQNVNESTNQIVNQPVNDIINQQPITSETKSISVKNFSFNPAELVVKIGTTVKWTNNDTAPHQIKSDTFNSTALNQGNSFEFKFDTIGVYDYSCSIHPSMKGKITVE